MPSNFDRLQTFIRILTTYSNAYCYYWHHPKAGTWMGATPERLLSIRKNKLETISLAGTLPVTAEQSHPEWSSKELDEQLWVTEYIVDSLKGIGLEPQVGERINQRAGALWHLKNSIHAVLNEKTKLDEVVSQLHPTPAVCGTPKQKLKNLFWQMSITIGLFTQDI